MEDKSKDPLVTASQAPVTNAIPTNTPETPNTANVFKRHIVLFLGIGLFLWFITLTGISSITTNLQILEIIPTIIFFGGILGSILLGVGCAMLIFRAGNSRTDSQLSNIALKIFLSILGFIIVGVIGFGITLFLSAITLQRWCDVSNSKCI
ncbi:MAG: hypothetical protein U0451_03455 [Candidatus Saccharimonadales bacterium]